jgi:transcriptional antiterminator RfaH
MPLLALEPYIFPDDLLIETTPRRTESETRWWVLHTRPRAEKTLARRALQQALPFFLPLYKKQWRSGGRLLCSHLPLFPGYLFLHGDGDTRERALETNLVANCLPVPDQAELHADLSRVFQLMSCGTPLSPEDRIQPGSAVEIVRGPLAGLHGTVLRCGKGMRLYVEVRFLHQGVSAEVENWMIRLEESGAAIGAGP